MPTTVKYLPIIGLEIHNELKTQSKMFCGCSAHHFRVEPNSHCCPVCLGLPGALPVPNGKAIEYTVMAGLAFGCSVAEFSKFDRKNYFYPDLPKGYQITQYDLPLCSKGKLGGVRIRRVHLEEDTAKLVHQTVEGNKVTLVDFNRAGVPLMEIVTEPDIRDAQQAKIFLKNLQRDIRYLDISDCDMEKGSMRLEINISVNKFPKYRLPDYKVEIKNLNSFRFVEKAINFEIARQTEILKTGKQPIQETRGWSEAKQTTFPQRVKEGAQDYRYFPEPDLPPLRWDEKEIERIRKMLPEMPEQRILRFVKNYQLSEYNAQILVAAKQRADFYEECVKLGKRVKVKAKEIANHIINKGVNVFDANPNQLIKNLAGNKSKMLLSAGKLEEIIKQVLSENQKAVEDFKKGKKTAVEFLLGQVIKVSRGQADSLLVRQQLLKKLS